MRRTIMYIETVLSAVALITVVILFSNPLRRSEDSIRSKMLKLTPIGTSMEDVIKVIDSNEKWEIQYTYVHGYLFMHERPSRHTPQSGDPAVGVKSIEVHLEEYRAFFLTGVSVFFGFDEDSKLIDIAVLKETDAL